jgi:hypothetical protein
MKTGAVLLTTIIAASATLAAAQDSHKMGGSGRISVTAGLQSRAIAQSELRLKAKALVASTADGSIKWNDKQAAVHVLSEAADLLWKDYPDRSGEWLRRAWEITSSIADEDADPSVRKFRSNSPRSQARAAILTVAQKYDRRLADSLLEQLADEQNSSSADLGRGIFDDRTRRSEQLLNMAMALAEKDPAAAASLAERSLADGVSFKVQAVLLALNAYDKTAANRVFDAALNRLASSYASPDEGQILASYLFTPGRVLSAGGGRPMALAVGTHTPALRATPAEEDPIRTRRFLSIMQGILLSAPAPSLTANPSQSAREFITLSGGLEDGFKRYAPDLWVPVAQRIAQVSPDLAPTRADASLPASVREKLNSGTAGADDEEFNRLYVEGLEEDAEKERDPVARKMAFVKAALTTSPGELERGRRIAEKISESDLRQKVVSFLVYRTALLLLDKGELDGAVQLAANADPVQHSIVLITAAQRTAAARPKASSEVERFDLTHRATELLLEADRLLTQKNLPAAALRVRLGLIAALASVDVARALQAFEEAVSEINDDPSFVAFDTAALSTSGLGNSADALIPRVSIGYGFRDAVTPLARADFDGAVGIANRLSTPSVRGTCMIEIARTVLSANPSR